jgi:hypothetical protein
MSQPLVLNSKSFHHSELKGQINRSSGWCGGKVQRKPPPPGGDEVSESSIPIYLFPATKGGHIFGDFGSSSCPGRGEDDMKEASSQSVVGLGWTSNDLFEFKTTYLLLLEYLAVGRTGDSCVADVVAQILSGNS